MATFAPTQVRRWLALRPWTRHSVIVAIGGMIYLIYGLSLIVIPLTADRARSLKLPLAWTHGAIEPWGVVWVLVGLAALASTRWPPSSEKWGYAAMSGLSSLWAGFYAWDLTDRPSAAIAGLCVWGLLTALWMAISGFPTNPGPIRSRR